MSNPSWRASFLISLLKLIFYTIVSEVIDYQHVAVFKMV
jgi:hypothetical protein